MQNIYLFYGQGGRQKAGKVAAKENWQIEWFRKDGKEVDTL